eukprot:2375194-Rhodomonas_salina.1
MPVGAPAPSAVHHGKQILVGAQSLFKRNRTESIAKQAGYLNNLSRDQMKRQTLSIIKMPTEDLWVKASILQKRVVTSDIFWQEKKLVLTDEILAIGIPGTQACVEHIPLDEIERVDMVGHDLESTSGSPNPHPGPSRSGSSFHGNS